MYGRYSANLAEYARQEARRLREDDHHKDEVLFSKELQPYRGRLARTCISFIRSVFLVCFGDGKGMVRIGST